MTVKSLSGAIVAGGKGERMSGRDKGLLLYNGLAMVQHVFQSMPDTIEKVFINANRNVKEYEKLGVDVVTDRPKYKDKGPLSGLFSCLKHADSSHLLISPCDTPNITEEAFTALVEAGMHEPDKIHYFISHSGMHPLHAILPVKSALSVLKTFLDKKEGNSVIAFYQLHGCHSVHWDRDNDLLNINRPEQLS